MAYPLPDDWVLNPDSDAEPFVPPDLGADATLADKIRAAVAGIASQIDLTTNISEEVLNKPAPPGSSESTMRDHLVKGLIDVNWRVIPTSAEVGDGEGYIDEPATALLQFFGDAIYDLGELVEEIIEAVIGVIVDIGAWLLDVVWTDIIVNQLIKWIVYIIVAGLRVVVGAPSYFLGEHVLGSFLSRLAGADLQQWFGDITPHTGASMSKEEQENWFDQFTSSFGFNVPVEGLVEKFMAAFGEGVDFGNLADIASEVPDATD